MKLNVSYADAQKAIRQTLNLPVTVDVIIGKKKRADKPEDLSKLDTPFVNLINFIDENVAYNRIACIKRIREHINFAGDDTLLSLKEAKDIVENWLMARPQFIKLGRRAVPRYVNFNVVGFE